MNNRHKIGEILEVTIEKIVPNGFGLAFAENLTVFVSLAAKGDKLLVKIYEKKGKIAFAEIVEIIEPSKDRTEPECPYFGICGGCNFQHLNYAAQLEAKVDIVKDCLARIGKINYEKEIQIIGSPKDYGYRARAQWHLDTRHKKFGYFQRNSHRVIDAKICPILTPELGKTLTDLRTSVAWESFWSEMVEIETATDGREVSVYSAETVETTKELCFEAKGEQYFYDATSFFQGNLFLIEKLIETATKDASGETAIDLYCGPRSGAEKETIETLVKSQPKQISYVSCEPSILARDLRVLTENLYTIESITALDLFPQTHHIETVVRLELKK
ncbi:MAG: TRAM domain-containing protein [Acidobacteria bacterium]|nr:TRAM domain-containing protein [Acidobacteriota bacterium]